MRFSQIIVFVIFGNVLTCWSLERETIEEISRNTDISNDDKVKLNFGDLAIEVTPPIGRKHILSTTEPIYQKWNIADDNVDYQETIYGGTEDRPIAKDRPRTNDVPIEPNYAKASSDENSSEEHEYIRENSSQPIEQDWDDRENESSDEKIPIAIGSSVDGSERTTSPCPLTKSTDRGKRQTYDMEEEIESDRSSQRETTRKGRTLPVHRDGSPRSRRKVGEAIEKKAEIEANSEARGEIELTSEKSSGNEETVGSNLKIKTETDLRAKTTTKAEISTNSETEVDSKKDRNHGNSRRKYEVQDLSCDHENSERKRFGREYERGKYCERVFPGHLPSNYDARSCRNSGIHSGQKTWLELQSNSDNDSRFRTRSYPNYNYNQSPPRYSGYSIAEGVYNREEIERYNEYRRRFPYSNRYWPISENYNVNNFHTEKSHAGFNEGIHSGVEINANLESNKKESSKNSHLGFHEAIHTGAEINAGLDDNLKKYDSQNSHLGFHKDIHSGVEINASLDSSKKDNSKNSHLGFHEAIHTGAEINAGLADNLKKHNSKNSHLGFHEAIHTGAEINASLDSNANKDNSKNSHLGFHEAIHTGAEIKARLADNLTKRNSKNSHLGFHEAIHTGGEINAKFADNLKKHNSKNSHLGFHEAIHTGAEINARLGSLNAEAKSSINLETNLGRRSSSNLENSAGTSLNIGLGSNSDLVIENIHTGGDSSLTTGGSDSTIYGQTCGVRNQYHPNEGIYDYGYAPEYLNYGKQIPRRFGYCNNYDVLRGTQNPGINSVAGIRTDLDTSTSLGGSMGINSDIQKSIDTGTNLLLNSGAEYRDHTRSYDFETGKDVYLDFGQERDFPRRYQQEQWNTHNDCQRSKFWEPYNVNGMSTSPIYGFGINSGRVADLGMGAKSLELDSHLNIQTQKSDDKAIDLSSSINSGIRSNSEIYGFPHAGIGFDEKSSLEVYPNVGIGTRPKHSSCGTDLSWATRMDTGRRGKPSVCNTCRKRHPTRPDRSCPICGRSKAQFQSKRSPNRSYHLKPPPAGTRIPGYRY